MLDLRYNLQNKLKHGKEYLDCCMLLPQIHSIFPLVVDTYVLQPPISTSGETAFGSQVLPKEPVVIACWCDVRVEP